jgi:hypothetical protein
MLTFDKRDLSIAAISVRTEELRVGDTYFHVHYVDQDMKTPIVSSLVYVGKNFGDDEVSTLYFQDVESYLAGVRLTDDNADPDSAWFESWPEDSFHAVFDFERALEELMRCSIRRKK